MACPLLASRACTSLEQTWQKQVSSRSCWTTRSMIFSITLDNIIGLNDRGKVQLSFPGLGRKITFAFRHPLGVCPRRKLAL